MSIKHHFFLISNIQDAGDETKETTVRVYGELRRLCNRVTVRWSMITMYLSNYEIMLTVLFKEKIRTHLDLLSIPQ